MRQIRGPEPRDAEPVAIPTSHEARVTIGHESGRRAERVGIVVLGLVILAFMKPWGSPAEPAVQRNPTARASPTPAGLFSDLPCTGAGWLVEADVRWSGDIVRTWTLTEAVQALSPETSTIQFVSVAAPQVVALGYCPPRAEDTRPHSDVTIYRLGRELEVVPTVTVTIGKEAEAAANVLYRPASSWLPAQASAGPLPSAAASTQPSAGYGSGGPPSGRPPLPSWPDGRYVIRIRGADAYERWIGVDIRVISGVPT